MGISSALTAGIEFGRKNITPRIPTARIASNMPIKERLLRRSRSSCFLRGETKACSSSGSGMGQNIRGFFDGSLFLSSSEGGGATVYVPSNCCVRDLELSRATLKSSADWKRSLGSTSMAFSIAAARWRETSGFLFRRGVSWALSIARARPSSGMTPVSAA